MNTLDNAVSLYASGQISIGKAAELSGLSRGEFETVLSDRSIERNYSKEDLEHDLKFVKSTESEQPA